MEPPAPPPRPPPLWRRFPASVALLGGCAALYAAEVVLGLVEPDPRRVVLRLGAVRGDLVLERGEVWRLLTAAFLHGGMIHLVLNGLALAQLGPLCEHLWGPARTLVVYLLAAIGGALLSSLGTPLLASVGASGAILGLAGLLLGATWFAREPLRGALRTVLGQRLAKGVALTFALGLGLQLLGAPVVDNPGHAGGLLTGIVAAAFLRAPALDGGGRVARGLAAALVALLAASFVAMLAVGGRAAARVDEDLERLVARAPGHPVAGLLALEVAERLRARGDPGAARDLLLARLEAAPGDLDVAVALGPLFEAEAPPAVVGRARAAVGAAAARAEREAAADALDAARLAQVEDVRADLALAAGDPGDATRAEDAAVAALEAQRARAPGPALDNALAWVLATRRDPGRRDPARAVVLAERAVADLDRQGGVDAVLLANSLDTLAVALAEAGRREAAVAAAERALAVARQAGLPRETVAFFVDRLERLRALGRP